MPGRNPRDAVSHFLDPIRECLNCFSDSVHLRGGTDPDKNPHVAILGSDEPIELGGSGLCLHFTHSYNIVKVSGLRRRPWRVSTIAYIYRLEIKGGRKIIEYHWHPRATPEKRTPHLHLRAPTEYFKNELTKAHLPTGRVSIEDFLEMAVDEFDVKPRPPYENTWRATVKKTRANYEMNRSWGGRT